MWWPAIWLLVGRQPLGDEVFSGALADIGPFERPVLGRPIGAAGRSGTFPDGHRYATVVFSRAHRAFAGELAIDQQIGAIAATAINEHRSRPRHRYGDRRQRSRTGRVVFPPSCQARPTRRLGAGSLRRGCGRCFRFRYDGDVVLACRFGQGLVEGGQGRGGTQRSVQCAAVGEFQPGCGSQVRQPEWFPLPSVRGMDTDRFEVGEHFLPTAGLDAANEHFGQIQRVDDEALGCRCA